MCPYIIRSWSRRYQPGDFFDASCHFRQWQAFALLRWIGADGRFYCDLYLNEDCLTQKTGAASFTREQIEVGFDQSCVASNPAVQGRDTVQRTPGDAPLARAV